MLRPGPQTGKDLDNLLHPQPCVVAPLPLPYLIRKGWQQDGDSDGRIRSFLLGEIVCNHHLQWLVSVGHISHFSYQPHHSLLASDKRQEEHRIIGGITYPTEDSCLLLQMSQFEIVPDDIATARHYLWSSHENIYIHHPTLLEYEWFCQQNAWHSVHSRVLQSSNPQGGMSHIK